MHMQGQLAANVRKFAPAKELTEYLVWSLVGTILRCLGG
jgi:hypothetical protein